MLGKLRFLKLPSYRRFGYQPLYYDPIKEELEERKKNIEREKSGLIDGTGSIERKFGQMRRYHQRSSNLPAGQAGINKGRNIRLIIIIAILTAIVYYLKLI